MFGDPICIGLEISCG